MDQTLPYRDWHDLLCHAPSLLNTPSSAPDDQITACTLPADENQLPLAPSRFLLWLVAKKQGSESATTDEQVADTSVDTGFESDTDSLDDHGGPGVDMDGLSPNDASPRVEGRDAGEGAGERSTERR